MIFSPGLVPGISAYSVKLHAKFASVHPAIRGVLVLHTLNTEEQLSVMENSYLTALRTGLAGAVAADMLAVAGASRVRSKEPEFRGAHNSALSA
jgi:ornithine cyclodeaminase